MSDSERAAWITRVLGVDLQSPGSAGPGAVDLGIVNLGAAASGWQQASETVDGQIASLQKALRQSEDDELREIAEFGLNAVTGNFRVPLTAALRDAEAGNARAIAALPRIAAAFRAYIDGDERVAACDANPFGVPVSIRATLGPALDELSRVAATD